MQKGCVASLWPAQWRDLEAAKEKAERQHAQAVGKLRRLEGTIQQRSTPPDMSGHLDLGAVRAVGSQAIKKIIPREFPLLKPPGWR